VIQHFFCSLVPVFLKAGADDVQMLFEGVLQTVVGNVARHVAEPGILGEDQAVIVLDVNVGAGSDDHQMEIRIQFIKIVIVFKAFAVGIGVEENIVKSMKPFHREKGAVIFQDIGFVHISYFKDHVDVTDS